MTTTAIPSSDILDRFAVIVGEKNAVRDQMQTRVREAERITGIIRGSNPNHHESSDTYDAYSEADFRFGFQSARLTLNALGKLAGISVSSTR